MGMTIQELCHYFWYSADSMEERYAGSCSARGPFFYSYSTTIACHCGSVYMLSEDGFSCTTATKHLAPLRMACPNLSRAIFVPFEYNDSFSSVQACVKTISNRLYHRLPKPSLSGWSEAGVRLGRTLLRIDACLLWTARQPLRYVTATTIRDSNRKINDPSERAVLALPVTTATRS